MKIRTDYVSNSSSSSFVLFGVLLDEDELMSKLKSSSFESVKKAVKENENSVYDILDCLIDDYNRYVVDECGTALIGMSPSDMKDDETLIAFKKRVTDFLKTIGIEMQPSDIKLYQGIDSDGCVSFD